MMMLPTFISADGTVPRGEKILVLDAGGTILRRAVAWFDENGKIVIDRFERYPMPGTRGELSVEAFFDEIAGHGFWQPVYAGHAVANLHDNPGFNGFQLGREVFYFTSQNSNDFI